MWKLLYWHNFCLGTSNEPFVITDLRRDGGNGGTDWQVNATHDDGIDSFDKPYQSESQKPDDIKVVILGAPGVGKTAIAQVCRSIFYLPLPVMSHAKWTTFLLSSTDH